MYKHSIPRTLALLLALTLLMTCAFPAYAETDGKHSIVSRSYTAYAGTTAEEKLNKEITLYFVDGVDDLPYMELNDWGELMVFVNTDNGDEDYGLSIEHKGDVVTLERENGYTMDFDFANDTLHYTDYDAFVHSSNDSTIIDLVSEKGTDENGIKSFRQLFWQIGFDEALSGNSAVDADQALKELIDYYLDDLHSVFDEYSYLTGNFDINGSQGFANRKMNENRSIYGDARDKAYPDGWLEYEEVGNTAYITFDHFRSDYTGRSYYEAALGSDELDDTVAQIIAAHRQITREGSPIENVVLDLSNNLGGAVDAAVVVLSWFLGDAPFSVNNMTTGAMSTAVYRADINLDHEYDEKDTVSDKNLFCLISPVSFSCGNLVPAALKSSQKVTLLGRTSGGGSCVVQPATTAYGTVFQFSAAQRMSFLKNGSFYDIDQGVEPDYYIANVDNYYNRAALTDFINGLF